MCVLEDIGYPKKTDSLKPAKNTSLKKKSKIASRIPSRISSNIKDTKQLTPRINISSNIRDIKQLTPRINISSRMHLSPKSTQEYKQLYTTRIYSSVFYKKKSPKRNSSSKTILTKTNVQEMLLRMKEETEKLDQEVRDIEKWNQFSRLEEIDSDTSLETLAYQ